LDCCPVWPFAARPGMPSTLAQIIGGIAVIGVLQSSALDW
jgi:hypothetical protein